MKVTTDACLFGAWAAKEMGDPKDNIANALDIGTGTGLLSLMVAQKNTGITIDSVEIDKEAAKQAEENIQHSSWKGNIKVTAGDIKTFHFTKKYDLIISNPPFYEKELRSTDPRKNIAHHSNDLGLMELFSITGSQLAGEGRFFFLLPYKRKNEIEQLLRDHSLFIHDLILVRQSDSHDYFRIMVEGGLKKAVAPRTNELSIWNNKRQYTPEFISLLREYYLNF
jgi:tRNA1Val (adenine37-N6)-methyltransferase